MGIAVIRTPVTPETVTVLGYKCKGSDPMWLGLKFDRAEPRTQASIMMMICGDSRAPRDVHLNVPFVHPSDSEDHGCVYRVRPRMKVGKKWKGRTVRSIAFERWNGEWLIAYEADLTKADEKQIAAATAEAA